MITRTAILTLALAATIPLSARAEVVTLKDGSVREGVVLSKTNDTITMQVDHDGLKATVVLNAADIEKIEKNKAPTVSVTPSKNISPAGNPKPPTKPLPPPADLKTPGFLVDMLNGAIGRGLDDPDRLPPAFLSLWNNAMQAEKNGDLVTELDALRSLESAFVAAPHGMDRLNAISLRVKQENFGVWLAQVHADQLVATIKAPIFDLSDVRDVERVPLIGMLKERTGPAIEPLKSYFPPVDEKTGRMAEFKAAQLSGISSTNAIEVKHQAVLASAILLAQIKLEPDMPIADRQLLSGQLQAVHHVLSRANELEPAAKAAADKADREKRIADQKALQEAAKKAPLAPLPPATTITAPH